MDYQLLLVKTITLLYLNGKISEASNSAVTLANEVADIIRKRTKNDFMFSEFGEKDPIVELSNTLFYMLEKEVGYKYDENELKQRFMMNVKNGTDIYNALSSGLIDDDCDEQEILNRHRAQIESIRSIISREKIRDVLGKWYGKVRNNDNDLNYRNLNQDILNDLNKYIVSNGNENILDHGSIVNNVNLSDLSQVGEVFKSTKNELDTEGVIRTPYQGLNRMLGTHGGIRRGECCVITALTHNYKSGLCLDLFMGCAMFNKPHMRDPNKKPMNLRISFENTAMQDFVHIYTKLKEPELGEKINFKNVIPAEAANFVREKLSINGYENRIIHADPTDFTFSDLFKMIERFEEDGFEIHLLTVDYLNMMSKRGCEGDVAGDTIRDLFRRVRNFCLKRGIAFVSPHQFSSDARRKQRVEESGVAGGANEIVKELCGKGYYDGCSRLEQELDLEISIHKVVINGEAYLTFQRGKHRGVISDSKNHYFVYKFEPLGGLPFDVDGPDQSRKSVGGDTQAEGGGDAWFNDV